LLELQYWPVTHGAVDEQAAPHVSVDSHGLTRLSLALRVQPGATKLARSESAAAPNRAFFEGGTGRLVIPISLVIAANRAARKSPVQPDDVASFRNRSRS